MNAVIVTFFLGLRSHPGVEDVKGFKWYLVAYLSGDDLFAGHGMYIHSDRASKAASGGLMVVCDMISPAEVKFRSG